MELATLVDDDDDGAEDGRGEFAVESWRHVIFVGLRIKERGSADFGEKSL